MARATSMRFIHLVPVSRVVAIYRDDDGSEMAFPVPLVGLTAQGKAVAVDINERGEACLPRSWPNFLRVETR